MAKFRMVHTDFWNDPRVVEEMTPEDKYFFLYLLTNPNTTQIGIYQITKKQMAFDMGYSTESITALLDRFINHHKIVAYNSETREIAIRNWGKYNFSRGGKPVIDCVKAELKNVKDISLISYVGERIEREEIKKIYESYYDSSHDTPPISGQEKEKEQEQEEEKEQEQEEEKEQQEEQKENLDDVVVEINPFDFYQQNFGVLNPFIAEKISKWQNDIGNEMVIEAMKRALNNQKKWSYAEGILKNWVNCNILTMDDVLAADKEFENKQNRNVVNKPNEFDQYAGLF